MALLLGAFILTLVGSTAAAEFSVLYSPTSLKFCGRTKTMESFLKEIISASLGLSVDESIEWKGMAVLDPFSTPEAAVVVFIDGVSDVVNYTGTTIGYALTIDEYDPRIYESVMHRIKHRFVHGGNIIVNIKLSDKNQLKARSVLDVFGDVLVTNVAKEPIEYLTYSFENDYQFLYELHALKSITNKVWSGAITPDNIVDFYNFRFSTLHPLSDFHGPNSAEIREAKMLLNKALEELRKTFIKAYRGSVLICVIASDVTHSRRVGRSPDNENVVGSRDNVASERSRTLRDDDVLDGNFPVIFNILFWFGIIFCTSLVAIIYTMTDMDPGRDSVIYRMTSIKTKKEV